MPTIGAEKLLHVRVQATEPVPLREPRPRREPGILALPQPGGLNQTCLGHRLRISINGYVGAVGVSRGDFGQARAIIGGVEGEIHYFVLDLPHSDACFVKAYPAETTEAFCDGHVSAFSFLGGVPRSIVYDNTTLAVAKILGDGRRQRTRVFSELVSHYLFKDRFGRPGKGNDKGKVEGLVGYARRNFLVPVPSFQSFDALNAYLEERCLERLGRRLRGHEETMGQRMERDLEALLPLPAVPYDASLCISPGAGLGKPSSVAPWPGCKPFHSRPDGQPATDPTSPQSRATPVRESPLLRILAPSRARNSRIGPYGPCAAPEDRPPASHLPQDPRPSPL